MPQKPFETSSTSMDCRRLTVLAFFIVATTSEVVCGQDDSVKTAAAKSSDEEKPAIDEQHPLYKLLEGAEKAKKLIEKIDDYECVFSKHELVGKKTIKSTVKMKFREQPFSVYLNYLDVNARREVIYIQGKNNDNPLVHEGGLKAMLGTFKLPPKGPDAMADNRHPITSIGLKIMLDTVIKQWESEGEDRTASTQLKTDLRTPSRERCTVYEAIYAKPSKVVKYHITRLWIEDESGLAIGVQQFAFPAKSDKEPPVVEEYFYSKLNLKVELTDADFDKSNSKYAFR